MKTLTFGSITVDAASDGFLAFALTAQFRGVSPEALLAGFAAHGGVEGERWTAPLLTFVIRSAGRTVLVDTGMGPMQEGADGINGRYGELPDALRRAGVAPKRVDAVVFTHLHPDHIGWNFTDGHGEPRPMFPNARYIVHRPEWEAWNRPGREPREWIARNAAPLTATGQLELVDDGHEPAPGVRLLATPGHTPGHVSVLVLGVGEGGVITGDAAHHPAELEHPDWSPSFDRDPVLASRSRSALADRAERDGLVVLGGHFPPPHAGRVVRVEQRRVYRAIGTPILEH